MSRTALDKFGALLITRVRDEAIEDWRRIIDGRMLGEHAVRIRQMLKDLSPKERKTLMRLVPEIVDTVLHHLLWTAEQSEDLAIGIHDGAKFVPSLKDVSDGLAGELYSDDGWIARFSKESGAG